MKTIEMKLYTFEELSHKAKQVALNDYRGINTEFDWWECSYDTWKEMGVQIESFDLYREEIDLQLFYDEEDTAENILSFFGHNDFYDFAKDYLETKKKLKKTYEDSFDEYGECEDYDLELEEANDLFQYCLKTAILYWLKGELEYLESDEAVADTLEANEFEFTEYGKRFHL